MSMTAAIETPMPPLRSVCNRAQLQNVPTELTQLPQWVLWKYALRGDKWTKEPFSTNGAHASSTDPSTWSTYEAVCSRYFTTTEFDGVGFVFASGGAYVGVDLDHCLDDEGNLLLWAQPYHNKLAGAYYEDSPSGRGRKYFLRGTMPGGQGRKKIKLGPDGRGAIEAYPCGRYFTVTGNGPAVAAIGAPAEFAAMIEETWPAKKNIVHAATTAGFVGDDAELIRKACQAQNGAKFSRLWNGDCGDFGGDHSSADQALMNHLAFWTGRDVVRMERLFSQSGLGQREKWTQRPDYRQRTINTAIESCGDTFDSHRGYHGNLHNHQVGGRGRDRDHKEAVCTDAPKSTGNLEETQICATSDADFNLLKSRLIDSGIIDGTQTMIDSTMCTHTVNDSDQHTVTTATTEEIKTGENGLIGKDGLFNTPPIPLEPAKPPALDANIFPGIVGEMICAAARSIETPAELPATFALTSLAIAAQGRFAVRPEPDYFEPLSFWTACALVSGSRKSEAMKVMTQWGWTWQKNKAAAMEAEIRKAASDDALLMGRLKTMRARAVKIKDDTERALLTGQIDELEKGRKPVPIAPRILCEDVTTEHLATMVSLHDERMGIVSDESGPLDNWAGRYYAHGGANIDFPLKAYSGMPCAVDRGSRPSILLQHPLLTVGLSPQPSVIAALASNDVYRKRGLAARFWFFVPESTLGYRQLNGVPIPEDVKASYAARLVELLEIPARPEGHPRPLSLSLEAWRAWKGFAREIEAEMRPGGALERLSDWAGKVPGGTARVAALFHLAVLGSEAMEANEIQADSMARAISLARVATEHAKAVFEGMNATGELESARRTWREAMSAHRRKERLERYGDVAVISARDLWHPLRGSFKSVLEFEPVIRLLLDHNHLGELHNAETGKPGRPSRRFRIHPALLTTPDDEGSSGHSGQMVTRGSGDDIFHK
jgi:primase-polymerase (primpol)-like protein